jgi:chromosome segregation ATPase
MPLFGKKKTQKSKTPTLTEPQPQWSEVYSLEQQLEQERTQAAVQASQQSDELPRLRCQLHDLQAEKQTLQFDLDSCSSELASSRREAERLAVIFSGRDEEVEGLRQCLARVSVVQFNDKPTSEGYQVADLYVFSITIVRKALLIGSEGWLLSRHKQARSKG